MGILTLMGSGEVSPTMVKVHRRILDRYTEPRAVFLDTPFGFQENADQITEKVVDYFFTSLRQHLEVASYRSHGAATEADRIRLAEAVRRADYVFSGPGSPSYALRNWRPTGLSAALEDTLQRGGFVTLASAAAVTTGTYAIPVYEIYKVGEDPYPLEGLDILRVGVPTLVIPHFDNAEGGNHDTRYCYLGASRLALLRSQLPPDTLVVGIDEHTALVLDQEASSVEVFGKGIATFLVGDTVAEVAPGGAADIGRLVTTGAGSTPAAPDRAPPGPADEIARFDAALRTGDAEAAVDAALATFDASGSDPTARDAVRTLIVRLGDAARDGLADPRERIAGFVDALLDSRDRARVEQRWEEADRIRDVLVGLGIEVGDGPTGTTWAIR